MHLDLSLIKVRPFLAAFRAPRSEVAMPWARPCSRCCAQAHKRTSRTLRVRGLGTKVNVRSDATRVCSGGRQNICRNTVALFEVVFEVMPSR